MEAKRALLCASDKTNLFYIGKTLSDLGFELVGCGDTTNFLRYDGLTVRDVTEVSGFPTFLSPCIDGLHTAILAGILAHQTCAEETIMEKQKFLYINVVVCNLSPFVTAAAQHRAVGGAQNIDIEGVTLLEAAARNHKYVTVICDVNDYLKVLDEIKEKGNTLLPTRKTLALKAFAHICTYNDAIYDYFCKKIMDRVSAVNLPFGMNPHQIPAQIFTHLRRFPFHIKHGTPSFVNMYNALYAWHLVKDLSEILFVPTAACFKHLSPVGAAVGKKLTIEQAKFHRVDDLYAELSILAIAYIRARSADPLSSVGDFIALSDKCDWVTAQIISRYTSVGVIAPAYDDKALEILKTKEDFCILRVTPLFDAPTTDSRMIFGLTLEQKRNVFSFGPPVFRYIDNRNRSLPFFSEYDFIVAAVTLKYTQSMSVCYARDGQVIGLAAGQQSRIQCTRLAGDRADKWWLRSHPRVVNMQFKTYVSYEEMFYAIDHFVNGTVGYEMPREKFKALFIEEPVEFTEKERREWRNRLTDVSLVSDGSFTYRDNVERAYLSGVKSIAMPFGSENLPDIIAACEECNIVLVCLDKTIYHH